MNVQYVYSKRRDCFMLMRKFVSNTKCVNKRNSYWNVLLNFNLLHQLESCLFIRGVTQIFREFVYFNQFLY